jgi:hypothetical protein
MAAIDAVIDMIRMAAHLSFGVLVSAVEQLLTMLLMMSANPTSTTMTLVNIVVVSQDPANPYITLPTSNNQSVSKLAANGSATFHPSVGLAAGLPVESCQVLANITPVQALPESRTDNKQVSQTSAGATETIIATPPFVDSTVATQGLTIFKTDCEACDIRSVNLLFAALRFVRGERGEHLETKMAVKEVLS